MAIEDGRFRVHIDVPHDMCVYSSYVHSLYGREMKIDQVSPDDKPPEGGIKYPASKNIYQDPLTGYISLLPSFLFDQRKTEYTSVLDQATMSATDVMKVGGAANWETITRTDTLLKMLSMGYTPSVMDLSAEDRKAGIIELLTQIAIITILANINLDRFIPLLSSLQPARVNQGWHLMIGNFGEGPSATDDYFAFTFGRYLLKIGTTGKAQLWMYKGPNQKSEDPKLLDEWIFTLPGGIHSKTTYIDIFPIFGQLAIYFTQQRTAPKQNAVFSHNAMGTSDGHLVTLPEDAVIFDTDIQEWITTEAAPYTVMGNLAFRWNVGVYKIFYPEEGTYITPAETLDPAPPAESPGDLPIASYWDTDGSYVGGQGTHAYEPGKLLSDWTTQIEYKLVNGDIADGSGNPTTWASNGENNHPRIQAKLKRKASDPFVTPYHFGHTFRFNPVFVDDPREMKVFYCGKMFTLSKHRDQTKDSLDLSFYIDNDPNNSLTSDDPAVRAALWEMFVTDKRTDTTVEIWWEAPGEDRTQDILWFAGYMRKEDRIELTFLYQDFAIASMKFGTEHVRLDECFLLRPEIYDGLYLDVAQKRLLLGANVPVEGTRNKFRVADSAMGTYYHPNLTQVYLPSGRRSGQAKFKPKVGTSLVSVSKQFAKFGWQQDLELELKYRQTHDTSEVDDAGYPKRFFYWQARRNRPQDGVSPVYKYIGPDNSAREISEVGSYFAFREYPNFVMIKPEANEIRVVTTGRIENGELIISKTFKNTDSVAFNLDALIDPHKPAFQGRPIRYIEFDSSLTKQEVADKFAELMLDAMDWRMIGIFEIVWHPKLEIDDPVKVYLSCNPMTPEFMKGGISEITFDEEGKDEKIARVIVDSRYVQEWENGPDII